MSNGETNKSWYVCENIYNYKYDKVSLFYVHRKYVCLYESSKQVFPPYVFRVVNVIGRDPLVV